MHKQQPLEEVRKTVVLDAPIEKVWRAVATSKGIASWWMANTFEPVLGRAFILKSEQFGDSPCIVNELDPPYKLGFDWGKDWHLSFELTALAEGRTEFTLIHSGWDESKVTEFGQPHAMIRGIMNNGWESIVKERLVRYIEAQA